MNIERLQARSQAIRDNRAFELFVVSIIIISALLIGAKTYQVSDTWMLVLNILDTGITVIFLVEILIRFMATADKRRFFHNGWNVFDTLVVVISLIPVEHSETAMIGRLVRIFRVLRMVSIILAMPTL